ncbi:RNA polymerase sigma factor [Pseudoxanthomonas daejeonensis]|uniref:RNA polymerase subunit sigma-24 n=1 Tax=Pseudoxanthomonas daejeonensis TaxID=266062 RepID=A0ABQ6ZBA0_9GAMM|nr:RNA polymerase sigma factor [Pseudoxanthomonas daejeonensis]KAF1697362.1 RNA polymerase subunit sigma-24 [Pseudoxanthomonas daejeonensis]UNK58509.1 RNA polymerase sigma factor [Pseudoxanthomonas daejeonensis]
MSDHRPHHDIHRTIDAVWRMESARVIAGLVRMVRDVGLAEELAQDALVAALEKWPESGVPDNPAAWLTTTARNRAIDRLRHLKLRDQKHVEIAYELEQWQAEVDQHNGELLDDPVGDDLLRLMFISCHPVLPPESRVALTLRLLGGLETGEIARAFLAAEATVAQRIVRAKRTLAEANVPFEIPRREELPERLSAVLGVIYLVFNEGYAASSGDHWIRPGLCEEALRLGRVLAGLMPDESEVLGLVALMEIQASRLHARIGADGEPVLLLDQDRSRWDRLLVGRGLAALERAQRLGGALGPYALQAAIAACHARAVTAADTDWVRIVALYDALAQLSPSPVVELNRAVAVSMAFGPEAALGRVDALRDEPKLASYHLLPSVRGDLLFRLGRLGEARGEFERAAAMTGNTRERDLLLARAAECQP